MSAFYGMVVGNRSEATRGGSKASGFKSSCQSFDGSVITKMWYNNENQLMVEVGTNNDSKPYTDWNTPEFRGTFEDFKKALVLMDDIKKGNVSVVRHRVKKES